MSKKPSNSRGPGPSHVSHVARNRGFVPVFSSSLYKDEFAGHQESNVSSNLPLVEQIKVKRSAMYTNVFGFPFNEKRCRLILNGKQNSGTSQDTILYWMSRDQRVQDNWSLLYAQKLAMEKKMKLCVCFCLLASHMGAPIRHYHFMIEGLKHVEQELAELNIPFHVLIGRASEQIPLFLKQNGNKVESVICDFSPLREAKLWLEDLKLALANEQNVSIWQVDAHNVVPCWIASDHLELQAPPFRNKMKSHLEEYLTEFPPLVPHAANVSSTKPKTDWSSIYARLECDMTVKKVDWAVPGYEGAISTLEKFIKTRLRFYDEFRNEPNRNVVSDMSPWYHFGQVSRQRCALEVKRHGTKYAQPVNVYIEQTVVRRELSDNYCHYQPNYDNFEGAENWAKRTLIKHMSDKRAYLYTYEELDNFKTHDKLWNAAQIQMRVDGKMHTFLRMYWAKKIAEWTETPQQAVEYAVRLNDRYNLDGRDAPGYTGIMWSICGVHDHGFGERPCTGIIRCMTYEACKRKFDMDYFVNKYMNRTNELKMT